MVIHIIGVNISKSNETNKMTPCISLIPYPCNKIKQLYIV